MVISNSRLVSLNITHITNVLLKRAWYQGGKSCEVCNTIVETNNTRTLTQLVVLSGCSTLQSHSAQCFVFGLQKNLMPPRPDAICTPQTHFALPLAALEGLYDGNSSFTGGECCSTLRSALMSRCSHSARSSILVRASALHRTKIAGCRYLTKAQLYASQNTRRLQSPGLSG